MKREGSVGRSTEGSSKLHVKKERVKNKIHEGKSIPLKIYLEKKKWVENEDD